MKRVAAVIAIVIGTISAGIIIRPIAPVAFVQVTRAIAFEDRGGLPLGTVLPASGERSGDVALVAVAPIFLRTIVAVEDRRFARHAGIDALAIARAVREALGARHIVSGASTISMQLARLRYGVPRTPIGKIREAFLAVRIERGLSKSQILAAYVNRLPMGGNIVGVAAAARAYFGIPPSDLDLAQSALLAALPNDPTALDPYAARAALERRRQAIVADLLRLHIIGSAEATRALRERVALTPPREGIGDAPQLAFRLARAAPQAERVRTTLDRDLQRFLTSATRNVIASVRERGVRDAAAIVIDNASGDVLAYVGSPDYFARDGGQNDGVTALRQPGSTLKPFLYELAFERRTIRPMTILADVPTTYAIPGARSYAPSDYSGSFAGPVRPRIALANSLNVPAVRTLSAVGVDAFLDRLHALGFAHLDRPADYYGLGLTLGSGEVSLEELARAYATIARVGRPLRLRYRSDDPHASGLAPVGDAATWSLITDMLADPYARARSFGVASLLRLPFPSAVKTGTSSDFRDTWTVGFTQRYTVATWVGNFDGAPMHAVTGVTGAAPLWNRIMLHLAERDEPPHFAAPRGFRATPMCATTGEPASAHCSDVVLEYLDDRDRASIARLRPMRVAAVRIAAPASDTNYRPGGTIVIRAQADKPVQWSLDGQAISRAMSWTLPLRTGDHRIEARTADGSAVRYVRVAASTLVREHPGFTVVDRSAGAP